MADPTNTNVSALDPYAEELRGFSAAALKQIALPLGGIGTGTISLGGRGNLQDWEIFNDPNKGYRPPYTMGWIHCRQGRETTTRVLERKLLPPHEAARGLLPKDLAGIGRLDEAMFLGTYPFGRIFFEDDALPLDISLEAWNPMIPGQPDDSGLPVAILTYHLHNPTDQPVRGSLAWSLANVVGDIASKGGAVNTFRKAADCQSIVMTNASHKPGDLKHGSLALATTHTGTLSHTTHWDEPGWWDRAQHVWDQFAKDGTVPGPKGKVGPLGKGNEPVATLAVPYRLKPGQSRSITFLIAWSFPTRAGNYIMEAKPAKVKNHYAAKFPDAWTAARYTAKHHDRLHEATSTFEQTLFESTLPGNILDAASSQMSIMRSTTTMWLASPAKEKLGRIYAFEGCDPNEGCCPMNCTHVWNYEQSLAHLFPSLERSMRATDYLNNTGDDGMMTFRTPLPLGGPDQPCWCKDLPAADGQMGTVVKAYREWRISGDDAWLKTLWPRIKRSVEFAWEGKGAWDADADGVMEGVQHNTYDIDFFGPNTMCGSLYLAALTAGAEMAEALGDHETAEAWQRLMEQGAAAYDKQLFNGEFYTQDVRKVTADHSALGSTYKAGEHPKYQYGHGCLSDQLLGQWAAHVAGLGYVLPVEHVRSAIQAVFGHNFRADLSNHESVQRVYALNDEAGLLLCTWPNGKREAYPFPYSDEVWTGIEYQVAAHLIYEGFVEEGLTLVAAVRDRHDGLARNPWNEFECGNHYARAMASWSLLLAMSGQQYDGRCKLLAMDPTVNEKDFRCIYTANDAYGSYVQQYKSKTLSASVDCRQGRVKIKALQVTWPTQRPPKSPKVAAKLNGQPVEATLETYGRSLLVTLGRQATLSEGDALAVTIQP